MASKSKRQLWCIVLTQYAVAVAGPVAAFGIRAFDIRLPLVQILGTCCRIAFACFAIELIRQIYRKNYVISMLLGFLVILYARIVWMCYLLYYYDNENLVINVCLINIYVLAIGPLVRVRAIIGLAGASIFVIIVMFILIDNAFSMYRGINFFERWVS